jgi:hypothetical protein
MSWDVTVQRFSRRDYTEVAEIPDDESCVPLGSRADIQVVISQFFPSTDWSDPAWGNCETTDGSIEFNLGNDEPNSGFMMHIRASSAVVPSIVAMCIAERWQALDCGSGEFLERSATPDSGLEQWANYRKNVVGNA